jgi:hypothetical protein
VVVLLDQTRPHDRRPQVRIWFRVALLVTLLLAAAVGARALWRGPTAADQRLQRAVLQAAYNRTSSALAHMSFPPDIRRIRSSPCSAAGDTCGYSALRPPQLLPRLLLIVGDDAHAINPSGCDVRRPMCPTTVVGRRHGFRVVAIAFWHLVLVRHGKPPKNALPARRGHDKLFLLGSDVNVGVTLPAELRN